jgi:colicin import membrane protein
MKRKLKTYQTSQGFYDLAIAAPSMKAALEAWGASSNLFHQGFAKEADDDDVIAATMEKPGIVLRRPLGSHEPFGEHSGLPTIESLGVAPHEIKQPPEKRNRRPNRRRPAKSRLARPWHSNGNGRKGSGRKKRLLPQRYAHAVRLRCQKRRRLLSKAGMSMRRSRPRSKRTAPHSISERTRKRLAGIIS